MIRLPTLAVLLAAAIACQLQAGPVPATLAIATLNVRTKAANEATLPDAELSWDLRKGPMIQSILDQRLDVVSFQEPRAEQVDDLKEGLGDGFDCISIVVWEGGDSPRHMLEYRDDGTCHSISFLAVRVREIAVEMATALASECMVWEKLTNDYLALRREPEVEFSKGWDATFARAALVANFKYKFTQESFFVVNTHLDAAGAKAREEGAKLILSRISPITSGQTASNGPPQSLVFLLGDFNTLIDSPSYTIPTGTRYNTPPPAAADIEDNTFIDTRRAFGSDQTTPTSDSFGEPKDPKSIDYILVADNGALERTDNKWKVDDVEIISNEMTHEDETYAYSDHRMLVSRLSCSNCGP